MPLETMEALRSPASTEILRNAASRPASSAVMSGYSDQGGT
ncbi:MAG: hypothetical protein ABSF83_00835 [Nitrososphaerales archaeon]|jgi:hypothetical protein